MCVACLSPVVLYNLEKKNEIEKMLILDDSIVWQVYGDGAYT